MVRGSLRPSQVISTFGPGAIVDLRSSSVMIAGLDQWSTDQRLLVDEPRLQRALRVEGLYQITDGRGRSERSNVIPSVLFPKYMVCSACRRLSTDMYRWLDRLNQYRCSNESCPDRSNGGGRVFPARFLLACEHGHVDEFPWRDYVHGGQTVCRAPLRLEEVGRRGTIADVSVVCVRHGSRSMAEAFDPGKRRTLFPSCSARRPWLPRAEFDPSACSAQPRPLLRGASNLFFPIVRSALSIPPWSDRIQEVVARRERDLQRVQSLNDLRDLLRLANFTDLESWSPEQIWSALEKRRGMVPPTLQDLLQPEWDAVCKSPDIDQGEFQKQKTAVAGPFQSWLKAVFMIKRLKEVRAIQAFTRIDSWADIEAGSEPDPQRVAPLAEEAPTWLPALLTRGEGVFFQLMEGRVRAWEESATVVEVARLVAQAHDRWRSDRQLPPAPSPSSRYVLLHSLSHLLMRQMALECGYSTSALRERIYASHDPAFPMAGFLIYTSTPDSEGSLGGLVDLAEPRTLGPIIEAALDDARLCSSDPLCADTRPGDRALVNGAACHACMLLPETSCERSNRFLDRAVVVRTLANLDCAFV